MSGLSESVDVVLSQETKTVAPENFGLMLVVGPNINSTERTLSVSSLATALPYLAGGTASQEYIKLAAAFAQQNAPAIVKLGVAANTGVETVLDNAGTFTAGSIVGTFYLNGGTTPVTVTTAWITDKDTTMTAFAAALQVAIRSAIGGDTTSTVVYTGGSTHTIVSTPKSGNRVSLQVITTGVTGTMTVTHSLAQSDANYTATMNAIQFADDEWYQVVLCDSTKANVKLLSAWVEASGSPKLFATASSDSDIVNTAPASDNTTSGTIARQLQALARTRTATFFQRYSWHG